MSPTFKAFNDENGDFKNLVGVGGVEPPKA